MTKSCKQIGAHGATLVVAATFLARYVTRPSRSVAIAAATSPVTAAAGAALGLALAKDGRGRTTTAVSVAALTAQMPLFRRDRRSTTGQALRVTSANILLGGADAANLVGWAAARTDVLVVQELTPESVDRLAAAGIDEAFPHRLVEPRPHAAGIGVWSRHPITETHHAEGTTMPCLFVRLRVPGCPVDPTVVAVHLESPVKTAGWRADLAVLPTVLRDADAWAGGGCVVVAGDFNSTRDHRDFRDGLAGFADAAVQAGTPYAPTYPNSARWMLPLFVIDHVLTLRCTATDVRTAGIEGSDHRALIASIDVNQ